MHLLPITSFVWSCQSMLRYLDNDVENTPITGTSMTSHTEYKGGIVYFTRRCGDRGCYEVPGAFLMQFFCAPLKPQVASDLAKKVAR